MTLKAGTVVYHGTAEDFNEEEERLDGPLWVSDARAVAEHFALRNADNGAEGEPRILELRLCKDIQLPLISSQAAMRDFAEQHGISLFGVEEMRDTVSQSGIAGWVVLKNYPEGDDILVVDADVFELVNVEPVSRPRKASARP